MDALDTIGIAEILLDEGAASEILHDRDDPFALLSGVAADGAMLDWPYLRLTALPHRMHSATNGNLPRRRSGIVHSCLETLRDELAETISDALLPEKHWLERLAKWLRPW